METLKIKKVGEFKILNGFGHLGIDPEMTRIANKKELSELPEQIAINGKVKEQQGFLLKKTEAKKNAGRAHGLMINEKAMIAAAKTQEEINLIKIAARNAEPIKTEALKKVEEHSKNHAACKTQLEILNNACKLKREEYTTANPIFYHPPANQIGVFPEGFDISVLKELYDNLENQQIVIESKTIEKEVHRTVDESIKAPFLEYASHRTIEDFRGKQYFYYDGGKWIQEPVIEKLGVTKNTVVHDDFQDQAIEKADMTPEGMEEFRIQNLTLEQKETEKAQADDLAVSQSAVMKTKLEIKGSTPAKALSDSKAWYQEQLTEIESKYA